MNKIGDTIINWLVYVIVGSLFFVGSFNSLFVHKGNNYAVYYYDEGYKYAEENHIYNSNDCIELEESDDFYVGCQDYADELKARLIDKLEEVSYESGYDWAGNNYYEFNNDYCEGEFYGNSASVDGCEDYVQGNAYDIGYEWAANNTDIEDISECDDIENEEVSEGCKDYFNDF